MSELSFAFDTNISKQYNEQNADKKPYLDYFELHDNMTNIRIRLYPGKNEFSGFAKIKTGGNIGIGRWQDILMEIKAEGDNAKYSHEKAPISEVDWILLTQNHFYICKAGMNVPEDPGVDTPLCDHPICTLVYTDTDKKALRFLSSDYQADIHGEWTAKNTTK